jgi:hypothetical protein
MLAEAYAANGGADGTESGSAAERSSADPLKSSQAAEVRVWLSKEGATLRSWTRRWCVFRDLYSPQSPPTPVLEYFASDAPRAKRLGVVALACATAAVSQKSVDKLKPFGCEQKLHPLIRDSVCAANRCCSFAIHR